MWIRSHELIRNELPPDWVIEHVRKKLIQLKTKAQIAVGNEFVVEVNFSMHSEACYLLIRSKQSAYQYEFSFRSHDNYGNIKYDEEILLYEFNTWDKCERFF